MNKRLVVLVAVLLVYVLVACSFAQLLPQREARITSTPTRTPKPTFTATTIPTRTLTPSPTPLPSNTPTNTPMATNTPLFTNTPLPTDTPAATLTATNTALPPPTAIPMATPKPTRKPAPKPAKTPTPQPTKPPVLPFTAAIVRGYTQCGGYRGVTGFVRHANGSPYPGVAIGVWGDVWQGRVAVSEASGKFELSLSDVPVGKYKVAAVRLETCGQRDGLPTAVDCKRVSNVVEVTTTDKCEGAGANQVTEVKFTGP